MIHFNFTDDEDAFVSRTEILHHHTRGYKVFLETEFDMKIS
jgi:hypothetical protein